MRTFGNYFSSKYEAICALGTDRARRIGADLLARPAREPLWQAITHAMLAHYQGADQPPTRSGGPAARHEPEPPEHQGNKNLTARAFHRRLRSSTCWPAAAAGTAGQSMHKVACAGVGMSTGSADLCMSHRSGPPCL